MDFIILLEQCFYIKKYKKYTYYIYFFKNKSG